MWKTRFADFLHFQIFQIFLISRLVEIFKFSDLLYSPEGFGLGCSVFKISRFFTLFRRTDFPTFSDFSNLQFLQFLEISRLFRFLRSSFPRFPDFRNSSFFQRWPRQGICICMCARFCTSGTRRGGNHALEQSQKTTMSKVKYRVLVFRRERSQTKESVRQRYGSAKEIFMFCGMCEAMETAQSAESYVVR